MNQKKFPDIRKTVWGRFLDAVGQAASIIASARASITTLVCFPGIINTASPSKKYNILSKNQ
ncbi:hypothetical protein N7453_012184 [Penicillium expansum]|nr:hypothetical protein N7453_012184 [Penicillium expansum]